VILFWRFCLALMLVLIGLVIKLNSSSVKLGFAVVLATLIAYRPVSIGSDTQNYIEIFTLINDLAFENIFILKYEIGWLLLMRIFGFFISDFSLFLFLLWILFFRAVLFEKSGMWFAVAFSPILPLGLNGLRQFFAIVIFIALWNQRQVIKRVIPILFHKSAVILSFLTTNVFFNTICAVLISLIAVVKLSSFTGLSVVGVILSLILLCFPLLNRRPIYWYNWVFSFLFLVLYSMDTIALRLAPYVWVFYIINEVSLRSVVYVRRSFFIYWLITVCPIILFSPL
jgi:hypothetical protein